MELGKKIKQLRFRAGMTQEQLAERLGIGAQSVSKWENSVAMPDITTLPLIAEIFGVRIDDLFDLTNEQRLNRIENRMDAEEELPADIFREFEDFLQAEMKNEANKKRATNLIAYLYWHRMNSFAAKASRYAKESVKLAPNEKESQWVLHKAAGHAAWDWNMKNHIQAIEFWRGIVKENPESILSNYYLLDNLIADHRADEAEAVLGKLCALKDARPTINEIYRAHIALARFDEHAADAIVENLLKEHPDDSDVLFEAAQYYAEKCSYDRALECYELAFEKDAVRPRFQDALMGIAQICEIRGNFRKAAETYGRIVDLLENEWGLTEETDSSVTEAKKEKARLIAKA